MHGAEGYLVVLGQMYWLKHPQIVKGRTDIASICGVSYQVIKATECVESEELRRSIYSRMSGYDIDRIRAVFADAGIDAGNPYHPDYVPVSGIVTWVARFRSGWCPATSDPPSVRLIYEGWRLGGGVPEAVEERTRPPGDPHGPDLGGEGG